MESYNYHFRDKEDAQNWAEQVNGTVHDNTHSPSEGWEYRAFDKSYTVHEKGAKDE